MIQLEWDDSIASIAQSYADRCPEDHSNSNDLGENLAWAWPSLSVMEAIDDGWVGEEKPNYSYSTNSCINDDCGHYTQIIWAETSSFGCGLKRGCTGLFGDPDSGDVLVCNYKPPGNFIGERPYRRGIPCSDCDTNIYPNCILGLCTAERNGTTGSGSGTGTGTGSQCGNQPSNPTPPQNPITRLTGTILPKSNGPYDKTDKEY